MLSQHFYLLGFFNPAVLAVSFSAEEGFLVVVQAIARTADGQLDPKVNHVGEVLLYNMLKQTYEYLLSFAELKLHALFSPLTLLHEVATCTVHS